MIIPIVIVKTSLLDLHHELYCSPLIDWTEFNFWLITISAATSDEVAFFLDLFYLDKN
jgi:hypothetical protein